MSEHCFTVYVGVNITERPEGDDRTDAQYAEAALDSASLRDCQMLAGFADMVGKAWITGVEYDYEGRA